jgi:putative acetyltransferase
VHKIVVDDLTGPRIAAFLQEHLDEMRSISPPESKHALDLDGLRKPAVTFWTVLDGESLAGCGALKELDPAHAEIKSMRTATRYKNRGVASMLLRHMIDEARRRGYARLSLETGSFDFFAPARGLYAKHGFEQCEPFADYREDPNSVFMTRLL